MDEHAGKIISIADDYKSIDEFERAMDDIWARVFTDYGRTFEEKETA